MKRFPASFLFLLATSQIVGCLPASSSGASNETSTNGHYIVEGCNINYRVALEPVIDAALAAVHPAIRDIQAYGTESIHGYKALFKSSDTIPFAVNLLSAIAVLLPLPNLIPDTGQPQKPHFVCVQQNTHQAYPFLLVDPFVVCAITHAASFCIIPTVYVFICPVFWTLPPYPHPETPVFHGSCPAVTSNVFSVFAGFEVYNYQSYNILHELVHFYLQRNSLTGTTDPAERYSLNGCVDFNAVYSLHNPLNYQAFVAMVEQGCVQSPDPFLPPWKPADAARLSLDGSSPLGFSLTQTNASSSSNLTVPPANLSGSSGLSMNPKGNANNVATS